MGCNFKSVEGRIGGANGMVLRQCGIGHEEGVVRLTSMLKKDDDEGLVGWASRVVGGGKEGG